MNVASLKRNPWVRRGLIALAALLALWLLAWLAVPPILKSQLQKIASEKLGRQVTVERIEFKPWTLELTIDGLRIATADGRQAQLAVQRVYADAELQSLFRLAPVIDALRVEAPRVLITHRPDGGFDIDDVVAKLASPPDAPRQEASRFSVNNITISGGAVDFDDQTVKRRHELRDLVLNVPFLSNLASKREIKTEPKLAFKLNGSSFETAAASTPFSASRKTAAQLVFKGVDLVPYLGYMPAGLPVRLQAGTLDAELEIDFEQAANAGLKLSGKVAAHGFKLADVRTRELLAFDSLTLALVDVRPLEGRVHLGEVALGAPRLTVARDSAGKLNLLATGTNGDAADGVALPSAKPASAPPGAPAAKPAMRVQVDKVRLTGGQIGWRDQTTQPAAAVDVRQLALEATDVVWPFEKPVRFQGAMAVAGAPLKFRGEATDKAANVQTDVEALPLSLAAPYLAQSLVPTLDGKLSGQIDIAWAAPALKLKARRLAADDLALTDAKTSLASVGRFELLDADVDLTQRTLAIASFTATRPKVAIERDKDSHWMFERWLRTPTSAGGVGDQAKTAAPKPAAAEAAAAVNPRPWRLTIGSFALDGGAVSYADRSAATPVAVEVSALKISAQKLAPGTSTASAVEASGRIGAGRADPGRFDYKGTLTLQPVSAEGRLEIAAFPAHAFKAYYADALNVDIRRAYASYRGSVRFAQTPMGISLKLAGDTVLEDFRANSASLTQSDAPGLERANNQLLSWKALSLRGLQVGMAPGAPLSVDVRETTLTDFFARVIVDPTGRINLQNLTKKAAAEATIAPTAADGVVTQRRPDGETTTTAAAPAAITKAAGPAAIMNFGPMSLVNGKIDFTDQFVKPNYSADLSELTGRLSAFSSQPLQGQSQMADLELRGKAQQTAALDISGKINPLVNPLELDITAKMRDLDLAPLTPYSVRYAGHGIERGKLSMDVNYKITPDGRLAATNKLVLNQLQFGEEVKGAPNSLPVKLAVALLADRNGVIDLDLPLSGSLNDPQFSVGSLVFKALGNLIVKAVTAPFSLLANVFGGGGGPGESSAIGFDPGSATLSAAATQSLEKVSKALAERPALQMTVVGTSSLEKERDAYKRQRLRELTQSEKRRAAVRGGQPATAEVAPVTDAEYPDLLAAVYKRSDITKPRNLIGLAKDLPTKDMEDLLLASIPADEESMRQLAVERAAKVRDYLLAHQVPADRLFLGAVRTQGGDASWKPAAELNLATR